MRGSAPPLSADHIDGDARAGEERLIGGNTGLAAVMTRARMVSRSGAPVLLFGETGTGKEIIARAIHEHSSYRSGPFRRVNCGAIAPELIDSELFGHEQGAFTGAVTRRKGWFEQADGGTLFLDEVGRASPRRPGPAPSRRPGWRGRPGRRRTARARQGSDRRGHAPGSPGHGRRANVSRGSVLPPVGLSDRHPAAPRPSERHPGVRRVLRRARRGPLRPSSSTCVRRRRPGAGGVSMARERPRDGGGDGPCGPDRAGANAQRGGRSRAGHASAGLASTPHSRPRLQHLRRSSRSTS